MSATPFLPARVNEEVFQRPLAPPVLHGRPRPRGGGTPSVRGRTPSVDVPIVRGLRRWVRVPSALDTRQSTPGPVAQLVSAPPCHGGGRGFESRRGRSTTQPVRTLSEPAVVSVRRTSLGPRAWA